MDKFVVVHRKYIITEKDEDIDSTCMDVDISPLHCVVKHTHVNLFAISLFMKKTASGAEMMLPVNQRIVRSTNFDIEDNQETTINGVVMEDHNRSFQTNPCHVLFSRLQSVMEGKEETHIQSVLEANYKQEEKNYSNRVITKKGCTALKVTESDLLGLAVIFNAPILRNSVHNNIHVLDFKTILTHISQTITINKFQEYVTDILKLPFYDNLKTIQHNDKTTDQTDHYNNLSEFQDFIHHITPVFLSHNEGNHRALIGSRLFYGKPVDLQLPDVDIQTSIDAPPPDSSTAFQPIEYTYYIPKNELTSSYLLQLKYISQTIATDKTVFIPTQWTDFLRSIYAGIVKSENMTKIYNNMGGFCIAILKDENHHNKILESYVPIILESFKHIQPALVPFKYILDTAKYKSVLKLIQDTPTFTNLSNRPIGIVSTNLLLCVFFSS